MSDRIFGMVSLTVIAFFAWGTSLTQESFLPQPVGPKVLPYILTVIGAACAIYFILRPDAEPSWPAKRGWLEIGAAVFVMYAYAHLLPILGFVIASAAASAYFIWRFQGSMLESIIGGILISFGIYAVFHLILGLSLAKGPLGF